MKRYETTEKHPALKKGCIINGANEVLAENNGRIDLIMDVEEDDIKDWIDCDWIREIQEPKWTDSDLIELLEDYTTDNEHLGKNIDYYVDNWVKNKKKS